MLPAPPESHLAAATRGAQAPSLGGEGAALVPLFLGAPPPLFAAAAEQGPPVQIPDAAPRLAAPPATASPSRIEPAPAPEGLVEAPRPPPLVFPAATSPAGVVAPPAAPAASATSTSAGAAGTTSGAPSPAASSGAARAVRTGDKGPDVSRLQTLLNGAGALPPLRVDGSFGPGTEKAVRAFQEAHGLRPDGVAGSRTFRALEAVADGVVSKPTATQPRPPAQSPDTHPLAAAAGDFCFPLAFRPSPDWHTGARYFGARRSGGKRLHAGCDLLGPKGTPIYAVADGTLVRPPYHFYSGTDAVELRHGPYIVRYGEILPGSYTGGARVTKGQQICKIGRLKSGSSMLHFEMYSNGASSASLSGSGPYKRRADLMNPTALLDEWAKKLPR